MNNLFYRLHYHHIILGLIISIFIMVGIVAFVLYQTSHRPLPNFFALQANGQNMQLQSHDLPNLLPETILNWAMKAATIAYTYDFNNYNVQLTTARPYFTQAGWDGYQQSVSGLIDTVTKNKLFVNGVVAGAPVISNEGPLGDAEYAWEVQIPFLVAYQSASEVPYQRNYFVVLTIVRVPTSDNPQAIGIDQFIMR